MASKIRLSMGAEESMDGKRAAAHGKKKGSEQ